MVISRQATRELQNVQRQLQQLKRTAAKCGVRIESKRIHSQTDLNRIKRQLKQSGYTASQINAFMRDLKSIEKYFK